MASIKLTINDASARADVDGVLTAGSSNVAVSVEIKGGAWEQLVPKFYARNGDTDMPMVVEADGHTTVPPECMIARGLLELGIQGLSADGLEVLNTIWASCGIVSRSTHDAILQALKLMYMG